MKKRRRRFSTKAKTGRKFENGMERVEFTCRKAFMDHCIILSYVGQEHGSKMWNAQALLLVFGVYLEDCFLALISDCLNSFAEISGTQNHVSVSRELQTEGGKPNLLPSHMSIGVLLEIGRRCSSKVLCLGSSYL